MPPHPTVMDAPPRMPPPLPGRYWGGGLRSMRLHCPRGGSLRILGVRSPRTLPPPPGRYL